MDSKGQIEIIPFDSKYSKDFSDLNVAWLEKYFVVEAHDVDLLERCEETIIQNGGYIFFAKSNTTIAGTFALIKKQNGIYELGKMAVSPEFQGQQIGQKLMSFCIDFAEKQHWTKILLYSNTVLKNAIHIYKKFGFVEIDLENDSPYQRSNIKMELKF